MRRLLYYSLLCLLWISVDSCKDDEVAAPPKPSFTVDKTSGLYNATEFTFTIDQVEGTISLLPYGVENPSFGGVNVPASSFTNGKATVKFTYPKIGTYNAVVVANNHSTDGNSIKNVYSDAKTITITSDQTSISAFSFKDIADGAIKDKVKTDDDSISITVPYGTDLTKVTPVYTSSDFSTVAASGADFSSPVSYVVTSQDGLKKSTYVVRTTVTPIETLNSFKSFSAILSSASGKGKAVPASVDSVAGKIVIYDTLGASHNPFDSVELAYELRGKFAYVRYSNNKHVASGDTLDLSASKAFTLVPQDSTAAAPFGKVNYSLYAVDAPKLTLEFPTLIPSVVGVNENFDITMNVLPDPEDEDNTYLETVATTATIESPATVTGIPSIRIKEGDNAWKPFAGVVDFSDTVLFELTVTDSAIGSGTYKVIYTAKATVLK